MAQSSTRSKTAGTSSNRNMDDAIARVRAAATAADAHKKRAGQRRIFNKDQISTHYPLAKRVRLGALLAVIIGVMIILFLPDNYFFHFLGFSAMFALFIIGVPNLILHTNGELSIGKLIGWCAIICFFGAMTSVSAGPTGNLWSWSPWMDQLHGGPTHVLPHK